MNFERAALALLLLGCGAAREPAPAPVAAGHYSVHEWGVVRGGPGDTLDALVIGPPATTTALVVLKPVLYFHLAGGPMALTSARVTAVEGEIREHFPVTTSETFPSSVEWGALRIEPGACATALPMPSLEAGPCNVLPPGEACEAATLGMVVTRDADCVVRSEGPTPFLFYRSSTRGLTVPLRATRSPNGDLTITNEGPLPIPGRLVRIQRSGALSVATATPPLPGESVTLGATWSSADDGSAAITEALTSLGLTVEEISAFHRAWDPTLFDDVITTLDLAPPAMEESIFYFLPPELTERIATIELTPPPTEIRRAMGVWTAL